ncbi:ferredoxin--NADP reductase [Pedobacter duraquae]|uniref:Ring-1,2-phenylacetyl-CoA epoxidase subunit PaaE n=1 Tax=Pedobacter duraquae TaxID=425511 RepID=A0A4R6IIY8_9SPHI|nr:ferredoxin--NADP reductase [Pedobacter duraquae]TDO21962.1 ring-1,2-phenylacetyl-CoA epoxidase subunit PaaE [Pedobacter duraquae]
MNTYTLTIFDIRVETEDTVTLRFKQPALRKVRYIAGQYLTVIFRINGRRYMRPYSFSSSPGFDEYLEITVKRVLGGVVSNHINDNVKIGDSIEVLSPMGSFIFEPEKQYGHVFLWGVGSGITPLISIAKYILLQTEIKLTLVYGNQKESTTIFSELIKSILEIYKGRFFVINFYTRYNVDSANPTIIQGRIDINTASNVLKGVIDIEKSGHYICGPTGLKQSVIQVLQNFSVSLTNIYSESFELVKNPLDFENIETQMVCVNFKGQSQEIEVVKGKSILEAALDANMELPYSCQTGSCSTCKGKLISGEAKMIGNGERKDLDLNEYLLCCTHPLTKNVKVEI